MTAKKAAASPRIRGQKPRKKKTAKNRELKPRQAKLLKGIIEDGKSVFAAAIDAGYSPNTAQHPSDLLDTSAMRKALAALLAPAEKIAKRINEGLDAMETKFFQFQGEVTESRNVVAWGERRQYAELAARLKGLAPGIDYDPQRGAPNNITVNFVHVAAIAQP
jgi:O6-methylguanine-DNA--protein-cysteine methyltransferase